MKAFISKSIFVLSFMFVISIISSCTDDDDNSNINKDTVENTIQSGDWIITNFIDSGDDETNHFTGYQFTFSSDKSLIATNGGNTITGTWSITGGSSSSSSSGSSDDLDFNIFFSSPHDFEELTEDWEIISRSSTKIELRHISGGNGGTDLLTFEKI